MSHPSKIEEILLAKQNDFTTYLYFICTDTPEVNISRVQNRVQLGGHAVPAEKIQKRYYSCLENLIKAIDACDKCYLFDNSKEITLIAKVIGKELTIIESKTYPNWFTQYVIPHFSH